MAKIHITSGNGNELEGAHDQWKDWILEWVPSDIDEIMELHDKSEEKFAHRFPNVDGGSANISAPPVEPPNRPTPALRRVEARPAAPAPKAEPAVTIKTTMELSPRNNPRFQRPVDPAEALRQRRAAAQERFQQQVKNARQHAADVLANLGNAK